MANNIFYVYIRLRNATLSELPSSIRHTLCSNYDESMTLALSVCKELELEECLAEKVKFWKESMVNIETKFNDAELVIHQIQISNGGVALPHVIIGDIAEANLTLNMTYTVCKLI